MAVSEDEEYDEPSSRCGKHWSKRSLRNKSLVITFNEDDRREFITGFHKRKLQRRKQAHKQIQKKEREIRLEKKRKRRLALKIAAGEASTCQEPTLDQQIIERDSDEEVSDPLSKENETHIYEDGDTTTIVSTCEIDAEKDEAAVPCERKLMFSASKNDFSLKVKKETEFKRIKQLKKIRKGKGKGKQFKKKSFKKGNSSKNKSSGKSRGKGKN